MLEHLEVRGLAIIDRVELAFPAGFVVLTGETGAGKSLLVESLKLISGQRAQADMVRTGEPELRVEGLFSVPEDEILRAVLEETGLDHEGSLLVRRQVSASGRGRCWVNDVVVTAATLQRLAPFLLAIHGQHEHYGLADRAWQRALVDEIGDHDELVRRTGESFAVWREAADEAARLESAQARRRDRLDTIAFQLAEIDAVAPQPGEDVALAERRQVLRHAARLRELSTAVLEGLGEGEAAASDQVARARRDLQEMVDCGLSLADAGERLSEAGVLIEDVIRSVQDLAGGIEQDPAGLEDVESRLHRLEQLMHKYGTSLQSVLEHHEALVEERAELQSVADSLDRARREAGVALAAYAEQAEALDRARHRAGDYLAAEVEKVVERLNMGSTRLAFQWQSVSDEWSPLERDGRRVAFSADGVEECDLYFAGNAGEELRPMARIASGGELSRLHLGIRTVLRRRRGGAARTLLFDEVDSGLGGATASALAGLLADLAAHDQVLVVTHLPQVAAAATGHFRIEKVDHEGRSVTRVSELEDGERVAEIARMLAGEKITESALAHASGLLGAK